MRFLLVLLECLLLGYSLLGHCLRTHLLGYENANPHAEAMCGYSGQPSQLDLAFAIPV